MLPPCPSPTKKHTVLPVDYHTPSSVLCWTFEAFHHLACPAEPSMLSFSMTQRTLLFPLSVSKSGPFPEPMIMGVQLVYCPQPWASCKAGHFYFHDLLSSHCLTVEILLIIKTSLSHNVSLSCAKSHSSLPLPLKFFKSYKLFPPEQFLPRKHPCYGGHVVVVI